MTESHTIPDHTAFRQHVHDALKAWNADPKIGGILSDLCLVQLELAAGKVTAREATNRVLLQALNAMAVTHERDSALLRMRFLHDLPVYAVASRLSAGEASIYRWQNQAMFLYATSKAMPL